MGFWWCLKKWRGCSVYLQLENKCLCFKIEVEDSDVAGVRRDEWHKHILKYWDGKLIKPGRLGRGTWMTVAKYKEDYRRTGVDGRIDIDATVAILHEAEKIVEDAVRDWVTNHSEEGSKTHAS